MLTNSVYMYLLGIVILFFAGNIIQWVYFNKDENEEKDKKEKEKKAKGNFQEEDVSLNKKE